jgi:hypothetical protein
MFTREEREQLRAALVSAAQGNPKVTGGRISVRPPQIVLMIGPISTWRYAFRLRMNW